MVNLENSANDKIGFDKADKNSVLLNSLATHLELCRLERKTITYLEAADAIDVSPPQRIHQVTQLLETLIEHDHKLGQAIRAALVVSRNKTGLPGEGFFLKAQELGLMTELDTKKFHQHCLDRLFDEQPTTPNVN